jgi:methyl-accepting chemotaxis protein
MKKLICEFSCVSAAPQRIITTPYYITSYHTTPHYFLPTSFSVVSMNMPPQSPVAALVRRCLPPTFHQFSSEQQRKTLLTAQFALLFGILGCLYTPVYVVLGIPILAMMVLSFGVSSLFIAVLVRRGQSSSLTASLLITILDALIIGLSILTGGGDSIIWVFLPITPVIAILLVSRSAGKFWGGIGAVAFFITWVLELRGMTFANVLPASFMLYSPLLSVPTTIFIMFLVVSLFERNRLETLAELEAEKISVETKVKEARVELHREQEEARQRDAETLRRTQEQQSYLEESTRQILEAMQRFAFGDLTVQVQQSERQDDINKIFIGFNRSVVAVRRLVEQVIHNVEQTTSIAAHISSASGQMAVTSQEQSAQVTQIAASIEEMARAVTENAHHAGRVDTLTQQTGQNAARGAEVVNAAMKKIEEIATVVSSAADVVEKLGNSSAEIGEIVQVIEEIADQTNLLALNAAIEAARAGEQGRGFAVVADEVRKLAERTAQATKQISQTIKQIQRDTNEAVSGMQRGDKEVQEGLTLAQQAGEALERIVHGTQEVATMVKTSSQSMEQQSSSAEEIAKSIDQMAASAEETTVSLSEIARSTETLRGLTEGLQELVGQFEVGASDSGQINKQASQHIASHSHQLLA